MAFAFTTVSGSTYVVRGNVASRSNDRSAVLSERSGVPHPITDDLAGGLRLVGEHRPPATLGFSYVLQTVNGPVKTSYVTEVIDLDADPTDPHADEIADAFAGHPGLLAPQARVHEIILGVFADQGR